MTNLRKAGEPFLRLVVTTDPVEDMATTHDTKLGLTVSEAARHLGVSLSTVRRWSDAGHLRGYRTPGGQRRFSVEQLDDFLASLGGPAPSARTPEHA